MNRGVGRAIRTALDSKREVKNYSATNSYVDAVAATINPLSQGCTQTDAINGRTGDSISPKSLSLNFTLLSGVASTNSFHRVIVFQDRLNAGTVPTTSQLLDSASFNSTYALRNRQQTRFKILYDRIHGVVGAADSAATHVQLKLAMKGQIFYNGTGNVATDNGPGALFLLTMTDSISVSTATVSFYSSFFYHDD